MKALTYGILFSLHSLLLASFDEVAIVPEGSGVVHIAIPGLTPESTEDFVYYEAVANEGYEFVQWTGHHMGEDEGLTSPYYEHRWPLGSIETGEFKLLTANFRQINPVPFYSIIQNEGGSISYHGEWVSEKLFRESYTVNVDVGYVFLFWNLFPEGRAYTNQWIHEYDPSLPITQEIKPLSAEFSALETNVSSGSINLNYAKWVSIVEEINQLNNKLLDRGSELIQAFERADLTEGEILDLRPGCVSASVQGNIVHLEMKLQTSEDINANSWSDMVDSTGNAMKAEIEIPIDGEKRFYRFGN